MRRPNAFGEILHVAGGERKEALSDARRCARIGRATGQQERAEAWRLYARSSRRASIAAGVAAGIAQDGRGNSVIRQGAPTRKRGMTSDGGSTTVVYSTAVELPWAHRLRSF